MNTLDPSRLPAILGGARTAFLESAGLYSPLMSYELGAQAIAGLMQRAGADPSTLGLVVMGTVLHEVNTTNVARECMLYGGLPSTIPAYTVAMAGISPQVGVANLCDQILLGRIEAGIAGGTENFSDIPIRLARGIRRSLMRLRQSRTLAERLRVLSGLRMHDLQLELPTSSDFSTGMTMGQSCEAMAKKFGASRKDSDAFAALSHARALAATNEGRYREQLVPISINGIQHTPADNTARADASEAKLSRLPPIFDPQSGVITAGNSSRFTDGAGALLIGSLGYAQRHGLQPQAIVRDYQLAGVSSLSDEMLLGPAMSVPRLLQRNGLRHADIDVWEIHEAFATQVLINLACMQSRSFVDSHVGSDCPIGEVPMDKLNLWGGSLGLGNPFAATGVRLLMTAAQRLRTTGKRYAVVSTCAGGGLGAALLLENAAALG